MEDNNAATGSWGLPVGDLGQAWTIEQVAGYLDVGVATARKVLSHPSAPPKLRLNSQRCDRWNPVLVLAWLHGMDWEQTLSSWTAHHVDPASTSTPLSVVPPAASAAGATVTGLGKRPSKRFPRGPKL